MRYLLPLLLLSTAAPALADPGDRDQNDRGARHEQRQEQRQQQRAERPQPQFERGDRAQPQFARPERSFQPAERPAPAAVPQAPQAPRFDRVPRVDRPASSYDRAIPPTAGDPERLRWRDRRQQVGQPGQPGQPGFIPNGAGAPTRDSVADWRSGERGRGTRPDGGYRRPDGGDRGFTGTPNPAVWIDGGTYSRRDDRDDRRSGSQDWRNRRPDSSGWRSEWRRDPRYDWQRYRSQHRSIFRLGVYIDPFGWGYRQLNYGFQLYPGYYSDNYWLQDPSYYNLPMVGWPYRWVRYYNDAVLVDVTNGRVLDVIPQFFW